MSNQINLRDEETLTWAIIENGSGVLSLVLYAESATSDARPVAAVYNILPWDVKPALDDLDMIQLWEGVTYDIDDINTYLQYEATRPVAYTTVSHTGEVDTVIERDRMGYTAKRAFGLDSAVR